VASVEKKRRRGRPPKLTPEVQQKIVETLTLGNYRSTAARAAGVSYSAFQEWMRKGEKARKGAHRDFFNAVRAIETQTEVIVVGDLLLKAKKDPKLAKWWLAHRHPKRWGDNRPQKVELTGKDGGPLKIEDARSALIERLDRLAASKAKKKGPDE